MVRNISKVKKELSILLISSNIYIQNSDRVLVLCSFIVEPIPES